MGGSVPAWLQATGLMGFHQPLFLRVDKLQPDSTCLTPACPKLSGRLLWLQTTAPYCEQCLSPCVFYLLVDGTTEVSAYLASLFAKEHLQPFVCTPLEGQPLLHSALQAECLAGSDNGK